jgi:hypothetical protein
MMARKFGADTQRNFPRHQALLEFLGLPKASR